MGGGRVTATWHHDGPTRVDLEARTDALFGVLISFGVEADAAPYGGQHAMTREQRRDSERRWASHFWAIAVADDEQAEQYRDIARRHERGES